MEKRMVQGEGRIRSNDGREEWRREGRREKKEWERNDVRRGFGGEERSGTVKERMEKDDGEREKGEEER